MDRDDSMIELDSLDKTSRSRIHTEMRTINQARKPGFRLSKDMLRNIFEHWLELGWLIRSHEGHETETFEAEWNNPHFHDSGLSGMKGGLGWD
jgi:hypothetical protein